MSAHLLFLAVSLNEDVDTNKELVAHGYSNVLAGLCGTVYVFSSLHHLVIVSAWLTF